MDPATAIMLMLGGAVVMGGGTGSKQRPMQSGSANGPGVWKDVDAPRRIALLAAPIEYGLPWPGLTNYLLAVAYGESRGVSYACKSPCGPGWSRGWFQLRSITKCFGDMGLSESQLMSNEAAQVAMAACHARRLGIIYDEPGQTVQWRDIRRGWKYPKWTGASWRNSSEAQGNYTAFVRNLNNVGLSQSFASQRSFPSGLDVPHVKQLYNMIRAGVS